MFKNFPHTNIITDDFGNLLYVYSNITNDSPLSNKIIKGDRFLTTNNAVVIGSIIPCLNVQYLIHQDHLDIHKQSVKNFHESERNCNTCRFLTRVKHDKDSSGFLYGKCENENCSNTLYGSTKEHMIFHPDDPMHMDCYVPRWI